MVEEVKWRKPSNPLGVPVWSHAGIICTGETYKDKVKLTFARGAALANPSGLFNSSLDGNLRRAIGIQEGDTIDEKAFKALVRAAGAGAVEIDDPVHALSLYFVFYNFVQTHSAHRTSPAMAAGVSDRLSGNEPWRRSPRLRNQSRRVIAETLRRPAGHHRPCRGFCYNLSEAYGGDLPPCP